MADRRKEELMKKRQKLEELRRAREERKKTEEPPEKPVETDTVFIKKNLDIYKFYYLKKFFSLIIRVLVVKLIKRPSYINFLLNCTFYLNLNPKNHRLKKLQKSKLLHPFLMNQIILPFPLQ